MSKKSSRIAATGRENEAGEEYPTGAVMNASLQRFNVEQNGQRPDLQRNADQDRQDGNQMVGLPWDRVGRPMGDEA
ncbi:hypothetical protein [Mesorhizobium sp. B1-1-5]|uniref:hypothetical protein n=1 Tax=Mesorhizobium sp. B1-1-5 TaxID=2589979 RepID=UPI0015E373A3|nr:hypothetical protein [Mesorhizobium sp. B1-1-5]